MRNAHAATNENPTGLYERLLESWDKTGWNVPIPTLAKFRIILSS